MTCRTSPCLRRSGLRALWCALETLSFGMLALGKVILADSFWPDFPVVIRYLQDVLQRLCDREILVCYVCGSDLYRRCGLSR